MRYLKYLVLLGVLITLPQIAPAQTCNRLVQNPITNKLDCINGLTSSNSNGVTYWSGTSLTSTPTGGAGTLCLISTGGAAPVWGSCSGSASTGWSALSAPGANLSLSMGTNLTAWTWAGNTGANSLLTMRDTTGNTGTGYLFDVATAGTSTVNPIRVCAKGTSNCVSVDANALLSASGTGGISATHLNGTALSGLATGLLKNTTTTGVPSIAAAGTDYEVPLTFSGALGRAVNTITVQALGITNGMLAGSIAASKLVGSDIATVGTITTGVWHGTVLGTVYGGTGADTSAITGIPKLASGVPSAATAGTDYAAPGTVETFTGDQTFGAGLLTNATGAVNFSTSASTQPMKKGLIADLPATCTVGQYYFETDAPAGRNTQACTATDTWTLQGGTGVAGPNTSTVGNIPAYGDTAGLTLTAGYGLVTSIGTPGSNTTVPSEAAVRAAISASGGGNVSTGVTLTSGLPIVGAGTTNVTTGTRTGNTTSFASTTGATTASIPLVYDASGNVIITAAPIIGTYGGTNNAFFQVSGPATSTKTYTVPNANSTLAALGTAQVWTAAQTINSGNLLFAGSSSGITTLNASASAAGTLTLPGTTDTLVARTTTDTLVNKTIDTAAPNTIKINGNTLSATAGSATVTVPNATGTLLSTAAAVTPAQGGTGASNTATSGRYLKGDGVNFNTSSGAAAGVGSCTSQVVTTLNSDAAPTCTTLTTAFLPTTSTILDTISSTQGTVLYRSATAWSALAPGASGQFLQTAGAAANPAWATVSGTISGLTTSALVTAASASTVQTPSATATMDSSGNISTPGTLSIGTASSAAGTLELTQGTAPALGTTSVRMYAPTAVTSYAFVLPGTSATGFMLGTNSANVNTLSFVGSNGSGNVLLSAGTAAIASGKTLTANNSLTLGGADGSALSLGGNLTTSGAFNTTLTVTGTTNVTLPLTGTLMVNPMTTAGDLITGGASGAATRIGASSQANFPLLSGASAAPTWAAITYPTSATQGGLVYATTTTALASTGALAANALLLGGNTGPPTTAADFTIATTHTLTSGALGVVDLSAAAATGLKIPVGAGFAPTVSGNLAYDSTANVYKLGVNGTAKTVVMRDVNTVSFSATPAFDLTLGNTQTITLTANVTSSSLSNVTAGQHVVFRVCQDATGSRTFVWPTTVLGAMTIGSTASTCSTQSFESDGTNLRAVAPGMTNL